MKRFQTYMCGGPGKVQLEPNFVAHVCGVSVAEGLSSRFQQLRFLILSTSLSRQGNEIQNLDAFGLHQQTDLVELWMIYYPARNVFLEKTENGPFEVVALSVWAVFRQPRAAALTIRGPTSATSRPNLTGTRSE